MLNKMLLTFFAAALMNGAAVAQKPKVIAHRGFWNTEGSYENTISSLMNAYNAGVWGSEFDVRLTADDVPVIHHDAKTKNGLSISKSTLKQLRECTLANGEKIPTLKEYLAAGKNTGDMKLILEIKKHANDARDRQAVDIIMDMVRKMKLKNKVEYISFSQAACDRVVERDKSASVAYLDGDMTPAQIKARGYSGLDYNFRLMKKNTDWFAQARQAGITVNVWTVNDPKDMQFFIDHGADYITTDKPDVLLKLLE